MAKAMDFERAGTSNVAPARTVTLAHQERHLRRKRITLDDGTTVQVDLPHPVALNDGDALILDTGERIGVIAAGEPLYEVTGQNSVHLARLCWHIGNRHQPAQVGLDRILIGRDHVIARMLEGLGATVREIVEPFAPERGAYHDHGHGSTPVQGHEHDHAPGHNFSGPV